MNKNTLFKINRIKKLSFSENSYLNSYAEKKFKKINFSKYILNIKLNKNIENILLGLYLNFVDKNNINYPWFVNFIFIESKINWLLIKLIYLILFKYTKEPPILVSKKIIKKCFNKSKYFLNPIKRWKYGSNFTNNKIIVNHKKNDKILFYTLSNIEFKNIISKKSFLKLNSDILYYWYLNTKSYKENNIIYLKYSSNILSLINNLKYLNFIGLKYNENYIIFKNNNYIIFKRILNNYSKILK